MSMSEPPAKLTSVQQAFILHWGEMGEKWGVNRAVAQVHALLYLSPEPLDADAIAMLLQVARSNVSTSIKELRDWHLIRQEAVLGRRKEHFVTDADPWNLLLVVLAERKRREIDPTLALLRVLKERASDKGSGESPVVRKRLSDLTDLIESMDAWFTRVRSLPKPALQTLLKAGSLFR